MKLDTVKVCHGDGFIIINESDFDKDKHEKYPKAKKKPVKRRVKK